MEKPTHCRTCGEKLKQMTGQKTSRCINISCPKNARDYIMHFVSSKAFGFENSGRKLIDQLLKKKIISSYADLFDLDQETIESQDRMGPKSTQNLLSSIKKNKTIPFHRLIYALGIRYVDGHCAKILANEFKDIKSLMSADEKMIASIPEIGPFVAESIYAFLNHPKNKEALRKLVTSAIEIIYDQNNDKNKRLLETDETWWMKPFQGGQMEGKRSVTGQKTYIERTIQKLHGMLCGLAADKALKDGEIGGLYTWLNENEFLREQYPFCELTSMLDECLEDGIIDEDEREELLNWCQDYTSAESTLKTVETQAVRYLHGFLHGIIIDRKINDKEVYGLRQWLDGFEEYKSIWPFSEVWNLLEAILADGVIDEEERTYLINFCKEFSDRPIDGAILYDDIYKAAFMKNDAPVLKPVTAICDQVEKIEFKGKTFCFTGAAKSGKRRDLEDAVEKAGGFFTSNVTPYLNYLVIGAKSSPCWVYSTYGRKVEQAMKFRQNQPEPLILHEEDFIPHLRESIRI